MRANALCPLQVVLKDYKDVVKYLRDRFECDDWKQKHNLESNYTINEVVILEAASPEIHRRENEVYDRIDGITKSFAFQALRENSVLYRWFDCWCPACMRAGGPGIGSMDSNYQVKDCKSGERWYESTVSLQGTRGIGAQRKEAQRKGRELAKKLKPGVVIAVQDRENQNHDVPFLIGITQDTGDGSCIVRSVPVQASVRGRGRGRGSATNTQRRTEYINGTRFDEGDLAVSVKW
jgi:hypothetical protein